MAKKLTTIDFIEKAKLIHGNKYDYSLVRYINNNSRVDIICPAHGKYKQQARHHLAGSGCLACSGSKKGDTKSFIKEAIKAHGNKYDYSLVEYINAKSKIKFICHKHGIFQSIPSKFLSGVGCFECFKEEYGYITSSESFIEKAKLIHGNKYDYSLVEYINKHEKISIICKKHGVFTMLTNNHIQGCGCPNCNTSKGENKVKDFLDKRNINFIQQKRFKDCKNEIKLPFDFYLPKYNTCIEYDGRQHFEVIEYWGGIVEFKKTKKRDNIKTEYCKNNNIRLIRISYLELKDITNILEENLFGEKMDSNNLGKVKSLGIIKGLINETKTGKYDEKFAAETRNNLSIPNEPKITREEAKKLVKKSRDEIVEYHKKIRKRR